jgi:acyl-coenzyme A synthetase/AMP-(fatty) acid ligase
MHPGGAAICRIFASSGTTGTLKFAAISHDLIARRIFSNMLGMGAPERVHICAVGFGITFGFCGVLRMLWAGGALVLTNPADCFDAIQRHQVSSMQIATGSLAGLLEGLPDDATPPPSLRLLETGGSLMPPRLLALTRRKLCANVQSYFGATESGGVASAMFSTLEDIDGAVGHIHPGYEAQAVDADDEPLPLGAEGRIRLRGANIIDGYFCEATPARDVFRDGWFYPGDVGSITASGVMTINGRESEFINAGGVKVNPRVIEDVLLALPDVTDAAAFGVPDRMGVTRVWSGEPAADRLPWLAMGSGVSRVPRNEAAGDDRQHVAGAPAGVPRFDWPLAKLS